MSQALYRTYRPENWDEVKGQDPIVNALRASITAGNPAHAYLFAGGRGTGKTSVARIFARALGCAPEDMYEIDAASNRGIDDIRELREAVRTMPFRSPYKVYIIDEVHMLTKDSFNALLKTLEEPPAHVIFILATTEIHKLLDTVVSRCQVFVFKKPGMEILKDIVLSVAKKEGYTLDASSAGLIALLGDGSFRDTLGILQKVIGASADKKLSREEVETITGAPSSQAVNELVSAVAYKDGAKGLSAIASAKGANVAMDVYAKLVLRMMRAVLLLRFDQSMRPVLAEDFSEDDMVFAETLAKDAKARINSDTLRAFITASNDIPRAFIPELPLELALMDCVGE
ncbi:MAG: DNA polymerase III subunit gamma/tau [Candidatus Yonathbacteria bacterium]|nr:DNA polymerase III subunit gamma/tau [Candidatus Yonathbacteria bacterium]